jgi:hypothetical protein
MMNKKGSQVMGQEKRKRTRVPAHFDVNILLGNNVIHAEIINISLTGFLCTATPLLKQDAICKAVISLGDALKIEIDSKILRTDDGQSAISFMSMDDESFIHLKRLIQYNEGDADIIDDELYEKAFC